MAFRRTGFLVAALVTLALAIPAAAQFNPAFNHLKCYRIKGKTVLKTLVVENQFGRERIVKLTPMLLCTPTRKTCCSNPPNVPGCNVVPCPPDPTPNQPSAIDHYKCYKIAVKYCDPASGIACATLAKAPKNILATLIDQFGTEQTLVGPAQILCAPVTKLIANTTTTTTTTTTTQGTTSTTSTTIPCRNVSQPGTPPMCAGDCPPGLACVFIASIGNCTCELGCAQQGGACNMQFCPKAGQQCIPNALTPCGCCYPPGAGPCTANADCCSGNCDPATQACQ